MIANMNSEPAGTGSGRITTAGQSPRTDTAPLPIRMLLSLGLVAPFLMIAVSTIAIGRAQGHNLMSDTFSDLAAQGAPNPGLMRAGMVVFGMLMFGFAAGLVNAHAEYHRLVPTAVAVFGTSIACAGTFRDYSEVAGASRNAEGFAHNTFGVIAIVSLLAAMVLAWGMAGKSPALARIRYLSLVGSIAVLAAGIIFNFGPAHIRGAVEMVLYVAALSWIFSLARTTLSEVTPGLAGQSRARAHAVPADPHLLGR